MSDVPPEPGTIIEALMRDHDAIKGLLARFDHEPKDEWGLVFRQLADYLRRHEAAEEAVVYPALRSALPKGDPLLDDCVEEQHALDLRLAAMAQMSPMDPDFRDALGHLRDAVGRHLTREDQVVIPMVRSLGLLEDEALATRYEAARAERAQPGG
jgi:hemerythrin-like domain-containing protein